MRVGPTLKQIVDTYGDKVRVIYRDYPLPMHPRAQPTAEAARCAGEQGKFWEFHDKIFASPQALEDTNFKQHATDVAGMNPYLSGVPLGGSNESDVRMRFFQRHATGKFQMSDPDGNWIDITDE